MANNEALTFHRATATVLAAHSARGPRAYLLTMAIGRLFDVWRTDSRGDTALARGVCMAEGKRIAALNDWALSHTSAASAA